MGMQVSRCVHIEGSKEEPIWMGTRRCGGGDSSQNHGSSEELRSAEFLGKGLLCIDGESRRGTRYAITSQSKRKWMNGSNNRRCLTREMAASWPDRIEPFTIQPSGFAGGT